MKANNVIINREEALNLLQVAEKRCNSRSFGSLESVEEALKVFLAENGFAKTSNTKLKNHIVTLGETTDEDSFVRYTRKLSYRNSNKTTWVELSHNGKGWKLTKAERGYTDHSSEIHFFDQKAYEEAQKSLKEEVLAVLYNVGDTEIHGDGSKFWYYDGRKGITCEWLSPKTYRVSSTIPEFYKPVTTEIHIDSKENLLCEDCTDCTGCFFCKDCKGCKDCEDCLGCTGCTNCKGLFSSKDCIGCEEGTDCKTCTGCKKCHCCKGCKDCQDCTACTGCTSCKELLDCKDCTACTNCTRLEKYEERKNLDLTSYDFDEEWAC